MQSTSLKPPRCCVCLFHIVNKRCLGLLCYRSHKLYKYLPLRRRPLQLHKCSKKQRLHLKLSLQDNSSTTMIQVCPYICLHRTSNKVIPSCLGEDIDLADNTLFYIYTHSVHIPNLHLFS